uniref:Uncharacterized protein n=1 Tax=Oryza meridionalis TaxID=40149 RepID=A0A0E0ETW3_9ORYZ
MYLAFIVWSDHCGTATIGTPALNPSVVEFHPQCVTKHPTAGCASTSSCGHHVTMSPLSCLAAKPSGILEVSDALTTQRKGLPVLYRPSATSAICAGLGVATLPKETYATVHGGLESSQAFVSVAGEKRWKPYDVSSGRRLSRYADGTVGPIVLAPHVAAILGLVSSHQTSPKLPIFHHITSHPKLFYSHKLPTFFFKTINFPQTSFQFQKLNTAYFPIPFYFTSILRLDGCNYRNESYDRRKFYPKRVNVMLIPTLPLSTSFLK